MVEYRIIDTTNFGGLNLNSGSTVGNVLQCDNFDAAVSQNATARYYGFLKKFPATETVGDVIAASSTRGLFLFIPSTYGAADTKQYLQAFSDGTVRYLNVGGAWQSLASGFSAFLPFDFAQYTAVDKAFWSNGRAAPYKWKDSWSAGRILKDKGGTPTAIAGATLTWNLSATVTSDVDISGVLATGDWIRRSNTSVYWDEIESVAVGGLTITLTAASGDNGASAAGGAQKAPDALIRGRFIEVWKDRVCFASGDNSSLPIVDIAIVGDVGTPLP